MWRIPLSDLNYDSRESEAVQQVLDSGWLTMGPRTEEFEIAFAAAQGRRHAVAVANCTCALELVYRFVLGSSEPTRRCIVVPDITFVATANAVITAGGEPLLCDIGGTYAPFLSAINLEELLKSRNDIAAVSLVHYAGIDAGAERIKDICKSHNVNLIEDCAHAAGAFALSGKALGSTGLAGCFSFFSNKNLSTGEGGMITTDIDELADWLRLARSHGVTSGTWDRHTSSTIGYDVRFPGYNCRCTEITAALGLAQLAKLGESNNQRRELTLAYSELLRSAENVNVLLPEKSQTGHAAYHILALMCDTNTRRNKVRDALSSAGVQTSHHYSPIHAFDWYKKHNLSAAAGFANADDFASRQITLPLHPKLEFDIVREIAGIVRSTAQ